MATCTFSVQRLDVPMTCVAAYRVTVTARYRLLVILFLQARAEIQAAHCALARARSRLEPEATSDCNENRSLCKSTTLRLQGAVYNEVN
jgi:hypothetical protein